MKFYLFNKHSFRGLVVLLIIICSQFYAFGQNFELGAPHIYNIPPSEYGYESQNYSITQDNNGFLYFGNLNGIMVYDGHNWDLIKVAGAFALGKDKYDTIYVGGYNEFGYLSFSESGETTYVSLIEKLNKKHRNFGKVGKILTYNDEVFFYSNNKLFKWDHIDFQCIDSSDVFLKIFKTDEGLYKYKHGVGLLQYTSKTFTLMIEGNYFANDKILEVLSYDNKLLIKTEDSKGFFLYSSDSIVPFYTAADDYIEANKFSIAIKMYDGNYTIGTQKCGLVVINKKGKILYNINMSTGLYNDDVEYIYVDNSNDLWLATSNGISRVELPDAFSYFDRSMGIQGGATVITRHNAIIYVATTQGLFYLTPRTSLAASCLHSSRFSPIKGIDSEGNSFFKHEGSVFLCTKKGLFKIENFEATPVFEGSFEVIVQSVKNPEVFYCGTNQGVFILKYENNSFTKVAKFNNIQTHIRTIVEEEDGSLWLGTNYEGCFLLELKEGLDINAKAYHFNKGFGLPKNFDWIDVYNTTSGILFSTDKGVLRYNKNIRRFYSDSLLGIDFSNEDQWMYPVIEDDNKNIWCSSGRKNKFGKQTMVGKYDQASNKYSFNSDAFNKLRKFTIESIYPDSSGVIWMASFDGLIRYDPRVKKRDKLKFTTYLRLIDVENDTLLTLPIVNYNNNEYTCLQKDSLVPCLPYKYNSIVFSFSAPTFKSEGHIKYCYILEGYDKSYSDWQGTTSKEYTNLTEGEYIFKVKAKDIFGNISDKATYKFHIKPPFYRSWWAYSTYIVFIVSFLLMVIKWRNYLFEKEKHKLERIIADRTEELVKQKERAEELVSNILPKETAKELKTIGKLPRKKYKMVTVLFSDIQGFTSISDSMKPEKLLDELDRYFHHFDNVVEGFNIEKIRTIGDSYMCAGGIPTKNRTNPIDVVMAALEMHSHMSGLREKSQNDWNIRIGIHSGPVIAGLVGSKKITYDIWGETVNIASRMEASGKIGEINISELTYELVHPYFECEFRSYIPVKYRGDMGMYFVKGLKKEFAQDNTGLVPNQHFLTKLQMIRFDDLEDLIMVKLEKGLPKNLYYHNLKHTIDVLTQVELIGRKENVSDEEMLMLKTAALFHDAGFLLGYDDHELLGVKLAKEILPEFKYTEEQIQIISELIYVTKIPPQPTNLLEEIICDADLDYLGRTDFIPVSQNLFRELYEHGKIKTIQEWNKIQVSFISSHQYYTETAQNIREVNKQKQLEKIKAMV